MGKEKQLKHPEEAAEKMEEITKNKKLPVSPIKLHHMLVQFPNLVKRLFGKPADAKFRNQFEQFFKDAPRLMKEKKENQKEQEGCGDSKEILGIERERHLEQGGDVSKKNNRDNGQDLNGPVDNDRGTSDRHRKVFGEEPDPNRIAAGEVERCQGIRGLPRHLDLEEIPERDRVILEPFEKELPGEGVGKITGKNNRDRDDETPTEGPKAGQEFFNSDPPDDPDEEKETEKKSNDLEGAHLAPSNNR
jgi:hypothetical protein